MPTNLIAKSFHNEIDTAVRAYQVFQPKSGWGPNPANFLTTYSLDVTYQFYPHFHPYVLQLARELSDTDSVFDLLAMNVLYQANSDGSLQAIPDSTRAILFSLPGGAQLLDTNQNPVLPGAPLTLLDSNTPISINVPSGTTLINADGSASTLSGEIELFLPLPISIPTLDTRGVQIELPSGTQVVSTGSTVPVSLASATSMVLPDETLVTLPNGASATLTHGTPATLPAGAQILLRTGLPLPQQTPVRLYEQIFTPTAYNPAQCVRMPYPVRDLDFSISGAYSIYNWELFFHAPLLIAIHLSQNQQFKDAQNWFHTIFDPTDDSNGPTPARFWKVRPFQYTDAELIQQVILNLSTGQDPQLQGDTINSINAWTKTPFQPFAAAQYRPTAYMLKTVMAYLDNLIAWGDSLFQQYTVETINEATQIYVLAANILGTKPQVVPIKESTAPQTYATIRPNLNQFSDALVDMEVDIPFDSAPTPAPATDPTVANILSSIGQTLFFCVPQNDTLLAYWDTVADRLFKIHNSLNIRGVFQKLPLFDPPIDPALLVRAAAEGLDINAIVSGLNQPLPLVRFQLLVSKASEICQEVKTLGANLLSAFEKGDNEALSLLRARHESIILKLAEMVKYSQWQEAIKARQALEQSLASASQRYTYYERLLGQTSDQINIPSMDPIDTSGLQDLNFSQTDDSREPAMPDPEQINPDISKNSASVSDGEIKTLSRHEAEELSNLSDAQWCQRSVSGIELLGALLSFVPDIAGNAEPMGCGASVEFGGKNLALNSSQLAAGARELAQEFNYQATNAGKLGGYARREQEWAFQSNLAATEISQVMKQLRAAQIREAIANKEYENHQKQIEQAKDIENFLQGTQLPVGDQGQYQKTTTVGLYLWMKGALQNLYSNAFQLAFAVAKKAELALQHELGDSSLSYIQSNYLDGMEGLLAGEKMFYDLKRMEIDYHDLNVREYEMTKQVSLLQVAPLALIQLRATGTCIMSLPEELFDLDGPGHYFRRIKSVAITVPCVTGPYTNVNFKLSLQNSSIRTTPAVSNNNYARQGSADVRFNDNYGTLQSIVTSSAQSDGGLFETNLHDERYLPFEYSGVISQWQLSLPSDLPQFDFDTITDVILHIRYTAREGGDALKTAAVKNLQNLISKAQTVGSVCLFSVRHEFSSQWARFKGVTIGSASPTAELQLTLVPELYPFWARAVAGGEPAKPIVIKRVEFLAEMPAGDTIATVNLSDKADQSGKKDALVKNPLLGNLLSGALTEIALPAAITDTTNPPITLYFDNNSMEDLWLALTWGTS